MKLIITDKTDHDKKRIGEVANVRNQKVSIIRDTTGIKSKRIVQLCQFEHLNKMHKILKK
jgi:hypothetical protein